jgi:general secretion pathway protein B
MSSILKALKKVEDDKATRRPDELRIDAEILRTEHHSRFSSSGMLLISLLLIALGAGGTFLYMKRDKTPEQANLNVNTISSQKQPPVSATPKISTEELPPAVVVVPADQRITPAAESAYKRPPPRQAKSTAVVARPPDVASQPVVKPQAPAPLPAPSVKTVPALRVNGIALQDGVSESVAMINGEPVTRGAMIAGVTVEEIYTNRVRFNYNGEFFEILLGQSNR